MEAAQNVVSLKAKDERRQEEKDQKAGNQKIADTKVGKRWKSLREKINGLKSEETKVRYEIGQYLNEISKDDLWRAEGGYSSFQECVQTEFGFTRQTACSYMAIAELFTQEETDGVPISSLGLLVQVPDEKDRKELLERVKRDEPTKRELAAEVKAKRIEAGLQTDRKGMEDTVHVSTRFQAGEVLVEFEWKEVKGKNGTKRVASFQIGDQTFAVEDFGEDGGLVRHVAKKR